MRHFSVGHRAEGFHRAGGRILGGVGGIGAVLLILAAASSASTSDHWRHAAGTPAHGSDAG
jgi:hypothetical protein